MIAIKDFKMPSCCYDCDFSIGIMSTEVDRECTITEKYVNDDDKPDWCPLVEVPDMNVGSCSEIPNNSTDCIRRQDVIDKFTSIVPYAIDDEYTHGYMDGLRDGYDVILELPSVQPKTTQVLAEVLDGCPLLHPCDELCKPEGWCMGHCKEGQNGPDKDCWMRYAEVMASERSD